VTFWRVALLRQRNTDFKKQVVMFKFTTFNIKKMNETSKPNLNAPQGK